MSKRWFILITLLLATAVAGNIFVLSVSSLPSNAPSPYPTIIPDDDGTPATTQEAKSWLSDARDIHVLWLLHASNRTQAEKNWDKMWVVRYKKMLQLLDFVPDNN